MCERTVLILHCKDEGIGGLAFSTVLKGKKRPTSVQKTVVGTCIEGICEYARIALDLASPQVAINVVVSGSDVIRLNDWSRPNQDIQIILDAIDGTKSSQISKIHNAIANSIAYLGEPCDKVPVVKHRLIIVYQLPQHRSTDHTAISIFDDELSAEVDVAETVSELITKHNASSPPENHITNCEVVLLPIVPENTPEMQEKQYTPTLTVKKEPGKSLVIRVGRSKSNSNSSSTPSTSEQSSTSKKRSASSSSKSSASKRRKTNNDSQADVDTGSEAIDEQRNADTKQSQPLRCIPVTSVIPVSAGNALQRVELSFLKPSRIIDAFTELCMIHYNIGVVSISGIPLKETPRQIKTTSHSCNFLYLDSTDELKAGFNDHLGHFLGVGSFWKWTKRHLQLKFRKLSQLINTDTLPSKATHRITPWNLSSIVARSLIIHVLENRPLLFCHANVDDAQPTHLFVAHQGFIYMVALLRDTINFFDLPDNIYHQSKIRKYRIQAFTELVEENRLDQSPLELADITETKPPPFTAPTVMANSISNAVAPPSTSEGVAKMPSENGIGSNSSAARIEHSDTYTLPTTKQLELQTRYFPYFEEESVLWCSRECDALKTVLQQIKAPLLLPSMTEAQFNVLTDTLQRLSGYKEANELKMFPNTKNSVQRRRELYVCLIEELRKLARLYKDNSPLHGQVYEFLMKLFPPPPTVNEKPPATARTAESTTVGQPLYPVERGASDNLMKQLDEAIASANAFREDMAAVARADLSWRSTKEDPQVQRQVPNKLHELDKNSLYFMHWSVKETQATAHSIQTGQWDKVANFHLRSFLK